MLLLLSILLFPLTSLAVGVFGPVGYTVNEIKDAFPYVKGNGTGLDLSNNFITLGFFSVAITLGGPAVVRVTMVNEQNGTKAIQDVGNGTIATDQVYCAAQYDAGLEVDPVYRHCNDTSPRGDRYLWGVSKLGENKKNDSLAIADTYTELTLTHAMRFTDRNTTWYLTGYLNITSNMTTRCADSLATLPRPKSGATTGLPQCAYGLKKTPVQVPITNVYMKSEVGIEGIAP
ncbi:MAG: hypothetical protein M1814_004778 [Vezdaea aestivalis]|nr:MAG: hypothetical protein M1814_004778 [Vezdaea aestivalis]